jgi:hypothetical protein
MKRDVFAKRGLNNASKKSRCIQCKKETKAEKGRRVKNREKGRIFMSGLKINPGLVMMQHKSDMISQMDNDSMPLGTL